jgi:hypothetical protein
MWDLLKATEIPGKERYLSIPWHLMEIPVRFYCYTLNKNNVIVLLSLIFIMLFDPVFAIII